MKPALIGLLAAFVAAACAPVPPHRQSAPATSASCDAEYEVLDDSVRTKGLLDDDQRERQELNRIKLGLQDSSRQPCWLTPWEKHRDYDLFSVEFDDQGWAADSFDNPSMAETQLKTLFAGLNGIYGGAGPGHEQPLNIVVYTHGWHHSARPDDNNVVRFRAMLEGLSQAEKSLSCKRSDKGDVCRGDASSTQINKARRVVGIYVGWRGDSLLGWGIENLSIWDRKTTAEKVAHGAIQDLYSNINQFYREHNCRSRKLSGQQLEECADVRMLTIGHSFGGLITYRALSSRLMAGIAESDVKEPCPGGEAGQERIRYATGLGNLTVLINPAFEGTRFEPLARAVSAREYQAPDMDSPCMRRAQLPMLVIAQSKGDLATKIAFPAFRSATTLFENTHGYGTAESHANISTVGWTERYQTHELNFAQADDECHVPGDQASLLDRLKAESAWAERKINSGFKGFDGDIAFCEGLRMKRLPQSQSQDALYHPPYSPVWTMLTDKDIIEDHNDVLNARLVRYIRQLYNLILREEDVYQKNLAARK